ncbi:hypothetical protein [Bradyrhizobium acaciae]|nr:hypothetical protein [Bradyrhizobium acaciae]
MSENDFSTARRIKSRANGHTGPTIDGATQASSAPDRIGEGPVG